MQAFANIMSVDDLRAGVIGKSNRRITREVVEAGVDDVLQRVFMGMMIGFKAKRAQGENAVIEYAIRALDRTIRYQVKVTDGQCTIHLDGQDRPDVTLRLSLADFLKLATRQLNLPLAVLTLRLRISGDRQLARRMARWF